MISGMEFEVIQTIALILGPGGAVYIGLKSSLNGMRKDVGTVLLCAQKIEDDLDSMQTDITKIKTIAEMKSSP